MPETLTTLLVAAVALPLVLYLPGWLLARWLLPNPDLLESIYERVVISALLSGWLALLLATFGVFSLALHLLLVGLVCAAAWWGNRRAPATAVLPPRSPRWLTAAFAAVTLLALWLVLPPFEAVTGARDAGVYANTGIAIARTGGLVQYDPLVADLAQQAQAADTTTRDAATQALANLLGVQHPERFIATRLYTAGFFIHEGDATQGRIVPQHLHLTSAWLGLTSSIFGARWGLVAPGILAVIGLWGVGMLGRRLAGNAVGVLAMLLLAINTVQVWFARYPTSETTAQFLIFAALFWFVRWQHLPAAAPAAPATPAATPATPRRVTLAVAALCGIAAGQVALARIDFFLIVAPLMAYLLYVLLSRRWHAAHTALAVGMGAMLTHAALHIIFIARAYFFDTAFARLQDYALTSYLALPFVTPLIREVYHTTSRSMLKDPLNLWRELALVVAGIAVLWALWRWRQPLALCERGLRAARPYLLGGMATGLVLLAGYAYFIRPQILDAPTIAAAPACLLPGSSTPAVAASPTDDRDTAERDPCLTLQGYVGAPIAIPEPPPGLDYKRMVPLANFVRMGWYLSPLGVVLGVVGFALWWWRGLNRASWLFLVVGLLGTAFFIRDTYGTSDQSYIYILRRFVPVGYPVFSLSMAYMLVAIARAPAARVWQRRTLQLAASGMAVLLVAFFLYTGRTVAAHVEYGGTLAQLAPLAAQFDDDDVLLLRGGGHVYGAYRDVPDLIATPLRYAYGVNALTIKGSHPTNYADALAHQIGMWQDAGRDVYLLASASGGSFLPPGYALQAAGTFTLDVPEFEQLTNQKPHNVARLRLPFAIYRLVPAAHATPPLPPAAPYTATDFAAQVRGFYLSEPAQPAYPAYSWTDGDAILRLPWTAATLPAALDVTVATGERPASVGNSDVCPTLLAWDGTWSPDEPPPTAPQVALPCFTPSDTPQRSRVAVPATATAALPPDLPVLLRLTSPAWVPATADPALNDTRSIGVQFIGLAGSDTP